MHRSQSATQTCTRYKISPNIMNVIITKEGAPAVQSGKSCGKDLIQLNGNTLKSFSKELVTIINCELRNTW